MAGTYSQVYLQFVFAVKRRQCLIDPLWEEQLYKYITGIITNKGHKLIAINGMPDHIHILIGFKSGEISDLVREIKKSSNTFINESKFCKEKFEWQSGYGVFSYHQSMLSTIANYIENQKKHHGKKSFKHEYKEFLDAYQIEYDERYLFEWVNEKIE